MLCSILTLHTEGHLSELLLLLKHHSFVLSQLRKLTKLWTRYMLMFMFMSKRIYASFRCYDSRQKHLKCTLSHLQTQKCSLTERKLKIAVTLHIWENIQLLMLFRCIIHLICRKNVENAGRIVHLCNKQFWNNKFTHSIFNNFAQRWLSEFRNYRKLYIKQKTNHHRRHYMKRFHSHRQITKWKESKIFSLNGT